MLPTAEVCTAKLRFDKEPKLHLVVRIPQGTRIELVRGRETINGWYAGVIDGKACMKFWVHASDSIRYVTINRSDKVTVMEMP